MNINKEVDLKKKIPEKRPPIFTLRLNEELIEKIDKLSGEMGVSKSKFAKSYIQLSEYFLVEPNLNLTTFAKMDLSIFPTEILKDLLQLLQLLPEKNQIAIGDKLGTIINNNFQTAGLQNLDEKRELIQGFNWIKFTPVHLIDEEKVSKTKETQKIERQFWGIPKDMWPISVIHAMLYRLIYNKKFNSIWEASLYKKYLELTPERKKNFKKNPKIYKDLNKVKDFLYEFEGEIGSRKENFEAEHIYYYFDVLRIEEEKNEEIIEEKK
ncbi:CopG family transcriptional regulator [Promethearchaeum syntrophicum]|uniref:CopG family transcriptional regulator n=1 Tax=Promethearchaeum syntrophicum TaxID=2594042 RepID=A0A5B9D6F2_9ARCH|nr:CopG family transcriptional regulator [Candidatus Prometheoarchaeum syntrophicum]QEE14585.1 hypothetical protein DSAG12_00398 [Candidatus Prometheoarchaeum syntrophicum]